MDELEATLRGVTTAIGEGRIGTPMAARIVVQAGDRAAVQAASVRALETVGQWFAGKPNHLDSRGTAAQAETTLARFPAGQSALVTVIADRDATAPLGVVAFGAKGVVSFDPACSGVSLQIAKDARTRRRGDAGKSETVSASPRPAVTATPAYGVLLVTGGFSHQEDYAKAFAADRRCKLIGLADEPDITPRRKQYNERLARALAIPVLPNLNEALARKDVHIVSICAEPERRGSIIVRAAEAGKHVYLDKPLAASLAEADHIVAAVKKAGVASQMFSMVHWPNTARIRHIVESGSLGKLIGVHVDLTFAKGPAGTADAEHPRQEIAVPTQFELRDTKRELTNVGVYPIVLLHWLLGERVKSVAATTGNYFFHEHQHNQQEDFGQILLTTESGIVASISAGRTGWHSHPSRGLDCTYLIGTEGIAVLDAHRPRLNVWADEEPWATPPRHPDDPMGFWSSTATYRQKRAWLATAASQHDVVYFLDCIERGKPSAVPATMAAAATEVLLAAYQSAATGKEVKLPLPRS